MVSENGFCIWCRGGVIGGRSGDFVGAGGGCSDCGGGGTGGVVSAVCSARGGR